MTLGEKIHRLRKARGMSQEELASHLTISRQAVSKWELAESVPDTENIIQLSRLFGVSTDYLLVDEYTGDNDVPHIKDTVVLRDDEDAAPEARRRKSKIAAYVLLVSGLVGILTLLILSSTIIAYRTVQMGYISEVRQVGPPMPAYSEDGELTGLPVESDWEEVRSIPAYGSVPVRGNLGAFLGTYNLGWLFALCIISAITGAAILLHSRVEVVENLPEDEEALP